MTLEEILQVPTSASAEELARDCWDDDNRLSYSEDGTKVLDAENFPSEVTVRDGCRIICDNVFAFQPYMAGALEDDADIPLEERDSFLEKIKLPSSITHIGKGAFAECGQLERISLPSGLLSIGDGAFMDCWQLEKISLPSHTRAVGACAFQGCINLYQIRLNRELEWIGEDAFDDCESLETIFIPHGMLDYFMRLLPQPLHELIEEL